jgi:pseudaminic acid biosynthesis-associated methylase
MKNNKQQNFWINQYAQEYRNKNNAWDVELGVEGWIKMLNKTNNIDNLLECGCNIGRNISLLNKALPNSKKSIIEISPEAFNIANNTYEIDKSFNGSIIDSNFENESFDLVFSSGVLIHIHPKDLLANMKKMFDYSKKYVLIAEYFNRTPTMIEYQGQKDKLFKSDFGKKFIENFDVKLVDYGFLWGHIYDNGGWDDFTWWLFEK